MASAKERSLKTYRSKRDFRRSPEPSGDGDSRWREDDNPIFVIQEHAASSHHYDFRLEINGVLKSWALPKGPSVDPRDRRLAIRTEDHPLDYADFEGHIPEGEYGAGDVIVWDAGPYYSLKTSDDGEAISPEEALEQGHLEVRLGGHKVRGGYALIHTKMGGKDNHWLLVKMKDEEADARRNPVSTEPESVLSGHTLQELSNRRGESG